MENEIKIGIEIECVLNSKIHHIEKGDYHEGYSIDGLPRWKAEGDSSLSSYDEFDGWENRVEFISDVSYGKKQFIDSLRKFKKFFSKNGKYKLYEVLDFNASCGSHVHLSIDNFYFDRKVIFAVFPKARKYFFNKVRKSKIESKEDILKQYNRSYSREINEDNWKNRDRQTEFNFCSEHEGKGFEWRSINMLNIKTWKEFFEFWKIVYKSIEYLIKISTNYSKVNYEKLIEKETLKDIKEKIKENQKQIIGLKVPKRNKTYSRINPKIDFFEGGKIPCVI